MLVLASLFSWVNAPFTVALGVAIVFGALQASGLLGALMGEHDGDGADVDGDVDDGGDDADDGDDGEDGDDDRTRSPGAIVWEAGLVVFGLTGIAASSIWRAVFGGVPTAALLLTLPLALVVGLVASRLVARAVAKLVADPALLATSRQSLVGHAGCVISSRITAEFGEIRLLDRSGHVLRVIARVRPGEAPVAEGREVVIVEYDPEKDLLWVAPLDPDPAAHAAP